MTPEVVPIERLQAMAALSPQPVHTVGTSNGNGGNPLDLDAFIGRHRLDVRRAKHEADGDVLELRVCPFNSEYDRGEAWIKQFTSGKLIAGCRHETCTWGWPELREMLEPGYKDNWEEPVPLVFGRASDEDISSVECMEKEGIYLDWETFWNRDMTQAEWVYEDVFARGRAHSVWAEHKTGKSQLLLFLAAQMATGPEPIVVVYIDHEMCEDDVYERLESMGYGPGKDLSRLRYALFPPLPTLDTKAGGDAVVRLAEEAIADYPGHHVVLFVDTIIRAVGGEENSSDTWDALSRFTTIPLKRLGVTWVRADQSGMDSSRGPRGSSGKGDDVDVEWHLGRTGNGVKLTRKLSRISWVPAEVIFRMMQDPLRYERTDYAWDAKTESTTAILDSLSVPLETPVRKAAAIVREAGEHCSNSALRDALKWRRQRAEMPL